MLQNYSKLPKAAMALILPIWVFVSFYAAQIFVVSVARVLSLFGISFASINTAVFNATVAAILYIVTLLFVIGLPWLVQKSRTNLKQLGLDRLPTWTDIFMTPAGLIVYLFLSGLLMYATTKLVPGFDVNQVQDTGFGQVSQKYELILAFLTLVVIAPVAEETLFRGYLYGKLKRYVPIWVAILITSVLFGFIHGAWNLAIDTFALSVIMCLLRESTGSIWASILLHMTKNGIAFYFLFIVGLS